MTGVQTERGGVIGATSSITTVTVSCDRCGASATIHTVPEKLDWADFLPSEPETRQERLYIKWATRKHRPSELVRAWNSAISSLLCAPMIATDKRGDGFEYIGGGGPLLCRKCRDAYRRWFGECKAADVSKCGLPEEE